MSLNSNQKAIQKGYGKIAKALGGKFGVYRPSNLSFAPICDPRNWIMDVDFAESKSSGFQSTVMFGVPSTQGFFDATKGILAGDIFVSDDRTYYVGDIPSFTEPMVIQTFNTMNVYSQTWDEGTEAYLDALTVNTAPCNLQSGGQLEFGSDPSSSKDPNAQSKLSYVIYTWLKEGDVNIGDKIVLDNGQVTKVANVFNSQQRMIINVDVMASEIDDNGDEVYGTQNITYWASAGSDQYGGLSYDAPITIKGTWIKKDGVVDDQQGTSQKTEYVIYSATLIPKRSRVVLGTSLDATPPDGSRKIMDNLDNPTNTNIHWHVA